MSSRIELWLPHAEEFLKQGLYLRSWSKTTLRTYRQGLSSLQNSLREKGGSTDDTLSKANLEAWVIGLKEKGLKNGGINMYIRTINSFLTWLKQEGNLSEPLKLRLLPNPPKPLKGFSDNEIRSLLSFRPTGFTEFRSWLLVVTLLDTGLRIEEALTLKTSDTDLDSLVVKVVGKGNRIRVVPFSLELRKHLFRYQVLKTKSGIGNLYVFCAHNGNRLSYRNSYRDLKWICAKAGVEGEHVHPHSLRHCYAVTYIRRGGDIYRLSRILGHTSISTSQIYLRSMGIEHIAENHSELSPLSSSKSRGVA